MKRKLNTTITYKSVHPGTDKTEIYFYGTVKELIEITLSPVAENTRAFFVTDTTVASLPYMRSFFDSLKNSGRLAVLESGETHKTIENVLRIIKAALKSNMQRGDTFIGIGGGVVCDMTAFAASVYKRGARLELVPTTILAMTDAAIGGKTGCDFDEYKNMIGTFYPAAKLHIAPAFAASLPDREYNSGLAEILKTALLYAPEMYNSMKMQPVSFFSREQPLLMQTVQRCILAKGNIVEQDLTEKGPRMQLNFGHTFAHALETCCGLGTVSHGEAVAWGISRALELSSALQLCGASYRDDVFKTLSAYGFCTQPRHPALPKEKGAEELITAMHQDKKNEADAIRCILQKNITETVIMYVPENDIKAVLT
ncbi:MAG: 3-dehydroquinate synthase [Bacteroides sp.]|nr:3-dehydroquinate synthase [Prevotella sp.]MCM1408153.1 3-dehydroquinate synthase [Treponema brennaborense]MCM1469477.1 3-dehydroquinate synthase [Bacteroides sp.]